MNERQSNQGKLVDLAFILGVVFLIWQSRISESVGFALLMAVAQARGAVGAVGKVVNAFQTSGPPSDRPPSSGSSGGHRQVVLPAETPKRDPKSYVERRAMEAVQTGSVIEWGASALALAVISTFRGTRLSHFAFVAVCVFTTACTSCA